MLGLARSWQASTQVRLCGLACKSAKSVLAGVMSWYILRVKQSWNVRFNHVPRKAFYLPLIWTALLPPAGASTAEIEASPAMAQLQSLGDDRHFKGVRRASLADVHQGQVFWRQAKSSVVPKVAKPQKQKRVF